MEKQHQFRLIQFFSSDILIARFRHISAYYEVMSNCETVSLLQFYKFIIKCWQWCLKGNKLMRLNKLLWNEAEIFRILHPIGTKLWNWWFYLEMVYLSLLEGFLWFPIKTFCSHALKCSVQILCANLISLFPFKHYYCQHLIINL